LSSFNLFKFEMSSNSNTSLIDGSQTIVRSNIPVPNGHILCHRKWQNSELVKLLRIKVETVFDDRLGIVDFHLTDKVTVIYLTESEILQTANAKKKIVKFRKGLHDSGDTMGLILAEKTRLTSDAFIILQNLAVIEFSMTMHPVADAQAATALLTSYIQGFSSKAVNPLKLMPQASMSTDQSIMKALTSIPGLGAKNAKTLILKFGSLQNIALATHREIVQAIGENMAEKLRTFLDS